MRTLLIGLAVTLALAIGMPVAQAQDNDAREQDGVPKLDHVFVIVLENHNSFRSFGSNGILDNPQAPQITALAKKYNVASNYNGVWHPSLPNYLAMITGNFIGTDVIGTGHTYPAGSTVGVSDDDSPSVAIDQLFGDLGSGKVPAFSYIVPDQCRDMHGLSNPLAPCGGASDTDNNDVKRGDDETGWLVNAITGSPVWEHGRNAILIVFDEGNGPLTCSYNPDTKTDTAPGSLLPGADCYAPANFDDKVGFIAITNYGVRGGTAT